MGTAIEAVSLIHRALSQSGYIFSSNFNNLR